MTTAVATGEQQTQTGATGGAASATGGQTATATATSTTTTADAGKAAATGTQSTAIEYKFDPVEGIAPEFDQEVVGLAKDLGLSQEQAAKFRTREIEAAKNEMAAAKTQREQFETQRRAEWEKANREHKEFGGAKYDETTERIKQLIVRLDTDQSFTRELDQAPELLSHPAFRGFLARAAYLIADGKFHEGGVGNGKQSSLEERLYPSAKA